jgi:hypothetical protein
MNLEVQIISRTPMSTFRQEIYVTIDTEFAAWSCRVSCQTTSANFRSIQIGTGGRILVYIRLFRQRSLDDLKQRFSNFRVRGTLETYCKLKYPSSLPVNPLAIQCTFRYYLSLPVVPLVTQCTLKYLSSRPMDLLAT